MGQWEVKYMAKHGDHFKIDEVTIPSSNETQKGLKTKIGTVNLVQSGSGARDPEPSEKVGKDSLPGHVDEDLVEVDSGRSSL